MESILFTNDNFVNILLPNHPFSNLFKERDNHEILFRRIHTFLILNKFIKNNIIDLGAWIGDNSIPWAKNIDGIVYAIDPSSDNCDFISMTCELNTIQNVQIVKCAISNVNELLSTNDDINHCSFVYNNPGTTGTHRTVAYSLDYLFETNVIENVGYIHLDVEGMEFKVLQGSDTLINTCRPIITFEQHLELDNYDALASFVKNKNYILFLIDEVLPGCRPDCRNSIAFPTELYDETLIEHIHTYIGKHILIRK